MKTNNNDVQRLVTRGYGHFTYVMLCTVLHSSLLESCGLEYAAAWGTQGRVARIGRIPPYWANAGIVCNDSHKQSRMIPY